MTNTMCCDSEAHPNERTFPGDPFDACRRHHNRTAANERNDVPQNSATTLHREVALLAPPYLHSTPNRRPREPRGSLRAPLSRDGIACGDGGDPGRELDRNTSFNASCNASCNTSCNTATES